MAPGLGSPSTGGCLIGDLCSMLRAQASSFSVTINDPKTGQPNVFTVSQVYARHADEDAEYPYVICAADGGDRCQTLDGNDESLYFTDVTIEVHSNQPAIDRPIAESIATFLEQSINTAMGSRTLFGCVCDQITDVDNPPLNASDEWAGGSQITAHLSHN
jgi:hypothetical protein